MGMEEKDWGANASGNNGNNNNNNNGNENLAPGTSVLGQLLGISSLFSDHRNMKEVSEVIEVIQKRVKAFNQDTLPAAHKAILPDITGLTRQISPSLPGVCVSKVFSGTMYLMPVLFITENIAHSTDSFDLVGTQQMQQVVMPTLPVNYFNDEIMGNLRTHYLEQGKAKGYNAVQIISACLIDLDMMKGDETLQTTALSESIASRILREWMEGILVSMTGTVATKGGKLASPFINPEKPYGDSGHALARIEAVGKPLIVDGQVTAHNLQVRVVTTNPSNTRNQSNSKSIVETTATVQLMGNSIQNFRNDPRNMQAAGYVNPVTGLPANYHPLRPLVIMGDAKPGEQMGDNSGLHSFFMGLYSILSSNNHYLFAEPFRRAEVGSRGNLSDLENRISQLIQQPGYGVTTRTGDHQMTEKKIKDSDFVNIWIQNNIAPRAVFASDILGFGCNSAINNFLSMLLGANASNTLTAEAIRTVITVVDSATGGKMTEVIKTNMENSKGTSWNPTMPILRPTNFLIPAGVFRHNNQWVDMGEIDEMFLSHIYKTDQNKVITYLSLIYGTDANLDTKTRRHLIRQKLNEFTDGGFHLNGFKTRGYWDPLFMESFGKAMDNIGTLSVGGTMGMFATTPVAYAPGSDMVTNVGAGNYGGAVSNNGVASGMGTVVFGMVYK